MGLIQPEALEGRFGGIFKATFIVKIDIVNLGTTDFYWGKFLNSPRSQFLYVKKENKNKNIVKVCDLQWFYMF